jgi:hypothetical protein
MTDTVAARLDRIEQEMIPLIHDLPIRQPAFLAHGLGDKLGATFVTLAGPAGRAFAQPEQENDEPPEVRPLFSAEPSNG